jgi:hypothetical protein
MAIFRSSILNLQSAISQPGLDGDCKIPRERRPEKCKP